MPKTSHNLKDNIENKVEQKEEKKKKPQKQKQKKEKKNDHLCRQKISKNVINIISVVGNRNVITIGEKNSMENNNQDSDNNLPTAPNPSGPKYIAFRNAELRSFTITVTYKTETIPYPYQRFDIRSYQSIVLQVPDKVSGVQFFDVVVDGKGSLSDLDLSIDPTHIIGMVAAFPRLVHEIRFITPGIGEWPKAIEIPLIEPPAAATTK